MVGHTRGSPEGFGRETGSGSQQPPPPPPNLAELMAMQTELLHQLVQGQQNPPRQQHGGRDAQPAGYQELFGTQPPLFSRTDEPLDADAWLRTIESKFALLAVPCADAKRHSLPPNSFVAPLVFGGITIVLCSLLDMLSLGRNSGMLFGHIIFLRN